VRQREPQLGSVLDRHDTLAGVDVGRQRAQRRRLPGARAAADQQRAARGHRPAEEVEQRRRQCPVRYEIGRREAARAEAADREQRPVERERREHDVRARAVGQTGIAQRLGLVRAPSERREDALDRMAQLRLAFEAHVGLRKPPVALHPDRGGPADHQLVDAAIAQQRLEWPEADRTLGDARRQRLPRPRVEHPRLALDERPDARGRIVAVARLAGAVDQPVAQRARQVVECVRARVHDVYRRAAHVLRPLLTFTTEAELRFAAPADRRALPRRSRDPARKARAGATAARRRHGDRDRPWPQ
jgi:hypothetical protein